MADVRETVVLIPDNLDRIPVPDAVPPIGDDWLKIPCVRCEIPAWLSPKAMEHVRNGAAPWCLTCLVWPGGSGDGH